MTKEKVKTSYLKTDFGKWVDEDEQDGAPNDDAGDGMDMGSMGDMGGMGGMGGMPGMGGMGGMPGGMDLEAVIHRPASLAFTPTDY